MGIYQGLNTAEGSCIHLAKITLKWLCSFYFLKLVAKKLLFRLHAEACWNANPLCRAYFGSLSVLPPFLSSHFYFFVSHCINMSCVWPKFPGPWMLPGLSLCFVPPALFDQSHCGDKYPRQREGGYVSLSPQSESVSGPQEQTDPL